MPSWTSELLQSMSACLLALLQRKKKKRQSPSTSPSQELEQRLDLLAQGDKRQQRCRQQRRRTSQLEQLAREDDRRRRQLRQRAEQLWMRHLLTRCFLAWRQATPSTHRVLASDDSVSSPHFGFSETDASPQQDNGALNVLVEVVDGEPRVDHAETSASQHSSHATTVATESNALAQVMAVVRQLQRSKTRSRVRTRGRERVMNRDQLVSQMLAFFQKLKGDDLLQTEAFCFANEAASDLGGVSVELLTQFMMSALHPDIDFMSASDESSELVLPAREDASKWSAVHFFCLGKIMVKCVVEQVPIPRVLAPSFFKYLVDERITIEDLCTYDRIKGQSCRCILSATQEELEAMQLAFEGEWGNPQETATVTVGNREAFVVAYTMQELVGSRRPHLEAIKRGMKELPTLFEALSALSAVELQEYLCGAGNIEALKLLHSMHFVAELPGGTLQQFTAVMPCSPAAYCGISYALLTSSQMVRAEWSQKELKEFLQFTTGLCSVPIHGLCNPQATADNRIRVMGCGACSARTHCSNDNNSKHKTVICKHLPTASTCLWILRLPYCTSLKELKQRFHIAFSWALQSLGDL